MQDISLHLLDIIENSARAEASLVEIYILIDQKRDRLKIKVVDNGRGMDEEMVANSQDPFFTTKSERKKKVGLGIPLFKQNAEHCEGSFSISSQENKGTTLEAEFQLSNVDRMPLGNTADTLLTGILGHPETDFFLDYRMIDGGGDESQFLFDTREIKEELGDVPLNYPEVTGFIRNHLEEEVKNIYMEEV